MEMENTMKNGLINENGILTYYENDIPVHAGVIKDNDSIYYIGKSGIAVTGEHIVHHEMTNGLLERGTYTFGEDGKLIEGSYIPPSKKKVKRKKGRLKQRIKRWLKEKQHKKIFIFTMIVTLLFLVTVVVFDNSVNPGHDQGDGQQGEEIELPTFENDVFLCSKGAQKLYSGEFTVEEAARYGAPYIPFVFQYNLKGHDGLLSVSENSDMSNSLEFFMSKTGRSLVIDNLKTNTQYFYVVVADGKKYPGSFKTARATRFIEIDGIYNTRDIGGYITLDGKTVNQGMIIRGTELDGLVEPKYLLSIEGKEAIRSFGFVYDMDLRAKSIFSGTYVSPLGPEVEHEFYTAPQYGQIFSETYKESLRQIFSDLAKPQNYPMYLHCTYGKDRTGTVVFLLQGILNVSEEQMVREYQMSGFQFSSYADLEQMEIIISGLEHKEGGTLQEKIVNYLIQDIGVLPEEIESIRNILLN